MCCCTKQAISAGQLGRRGCCCCCCFSEKCPTGRGKKRGCHRLLCTGRSGIIKKPHCVEFNFQFSDGGGGGTINCGHWSAGRWRQQKKMKSRSNNSSTADIKFSPAAESKEAATNNTTTTMAAAGRHVNGGDGSHFPMADLDNEVQVEARVD